MGIDASGISPTSSQVALSQLPEQLYLEESVETDNIVSRQGLNEFYY